MIIIHTKGTILHLFSISEVIVQHLLQLEKYTKNGLKHVGVKKNQKAILLNTSYFSSKVLGHREWQGQTTDWCLISPGAFPSSKRWAEYWGEFSPLLLWTPFSILSSSTAFLPEMLPALFILFTPGAQLDRDGGDMVQLNRYHITGEFSGVQGGSEDCKEATDSGSLKFLFQYIWHWRPVTMTHGIWIVFYFMSWDVKSKLSLPLCK